MADEPAAPPSSITEATTTATIVDAHDFVVPKKQVSAIFDMAKWYRSEAYEAYMHFLRRINDSVKSLPTTANIPVSDRINAVINLIDTLESYMSLFPLEDMDIQRYGNKTYRLWYDKMQKEVPNLVRDLLPEGKKEAVIELVPYLLDSFGNSTRIDYGSGHEAAFLMFVYCLYATGALVKPDDDKATVLRLFHRYLKFVRKLQSVYRMEPAGSRGVHAIDDYQFVPFIFGSSQLIKNRARLVPDHYLIPSTVEQYKDDNLFFEAVQLINEVKFGPFYEHSNQLYNISSVATWEKVNSGMFKMYEGECLKKLPVAQHFLFGSILKIDERPCFSQPQQRPEVVTDQVEDLQPPPIHPIIENVETMEAIVEDGDEDVTAS